MGCVDGVLTLSVDGVGGFRGWGWGWGWECLEVAGSTMSGRDCPSGLGCTLETGPALSEVGTEDGVHAEWCEEEEGSPSGEAPDVEANAVFVCDTY